MPLDTSRGDMLTFVFVDTNVFVHFEFFKNVDWAAELAARDVTLVLPPVVIEELDKRKWSGTRREKERAKAVLRAFKELGLSTAPAQVRPHVSIVALDDEPDDAFLARHRLQARSADDRLLASALAFKEGRPDARVLVLTADTGLAIKAPTRQMEVATPAERLELVDEPDETERALDAARRELAAVKNAAPKLRIKFDSGTYLELDRCLADPLEPVMREKLLTEWRARHPHVSSTPDAFVLPGGSRIDLSIFSGIPGYLSEENAKKHNAAIERHFAQYREYLERWPSAFNSLKRCVEIRLVLENDGSAPADDVHLLLWTQARGLWREGMPDVDAPPEMPKERSPFDINLASTLPHFDPGDFRHRDDPIDGPNFSEDPIEVEYTVRRVKHHVPCALPTVHFQFETNEDVASFAINYRLIAANVREPQEGQLNVRITLKPPVPAPNPEDLFTVI